MALTQQLPRSVADFFALPPADYVLARSLAANTAESITVPDGAKYVLFSADNDFYARYDGSAAAVATDVTDGSASELNPTMRRLVRTSSNTPIISISVISEYATKITAAFYKAQP